MNPSTPTQSPIMNSPISNMQDLQSMSTQQPQAPQPQQGGNFLERLLPTIGGVGGSILGSLASPFVGTAIGGGLGEGLGKTLENDLTGQSLTNGVGSDVASGATSGLLGAGLGKAAGLAGGLLGKFGEGAATSAAEGGAATQAAQQVARDSEMQSAQQAAESADKNASDLAGQLDAVKTANQAKLSNAQASASAAQQAQAPIDRQAAISANYGSILPKVQKLWNLGPNQDFVDSMGLDSANPYDMQKVGQAGLDLNNVVDTSLKNAPTMSIKPEVSSMLKTAMDGPYSVDVNQSPLGRALQNTGIDVTNTDNVTAPQVRNLMQSVGEEMGNSQRIIEGAKDTGQNPIQEESNLKDLSNLYDTLRGKLASNPAVNQGIKDAVVTPEMRDGFIQKYGPQLGDYLSTKITEAQNYDDVVPEMQKFAQMNRSSKAAIDDIEKARSGTLANKRTALGANPGEPAPSIQPVNPVEDQSAAFKAQELELQHKVEQAQLKAKQLHDSADMLQKTQTANANADAANPSDTGAVGHVINAVGNTAGGNKAGALTSLLRAGSSAAPGVASRAGGLLNRIAPFVSPAVVGGSTLGGLGAGNTNDMQNASDTMQQQANPLSEVIQANMAQNILAPGPYGGTSGSFLSGVAPQMQQAQQSQAIVNNLLGAYGGAGGAQGFGGGLLSRLSGMIPGTSANAFQQRSSAAAAQLAQLLGITPEAAQGMLPQLMQGGQAGGQAIGGLGGTLGALPL